MNRLFFATHNKHKLQEVSQILSDTYEVVGLEALGCFDEIPETGTTLQENALIKAHYLHEHYQVDCFADDTGLEVEALEGAPGVYSARYAGEPADSKRNVEKLMREMSGQTHRKARFKTVIAAIIAGKEYLCEGVVEGTIISEMRGDEGFGYDPVFVPDGFDQTFAEMPASQKNKISHRGRAVEAFVRLLGEINQ